MECKNRGIGYVFSIFSMVGNEFEESGFAPLAIAIHSKYINLEISESVLKETETIIPAGTKFYISYKNSFSFCFGIIDVWAGAVLLIFEIENGYVVLPEPREQKSWIWQMLLPHFYENIMNWEKLWYIPEFFLWKKGSKVFLRSFPY